jgi:hypothetical protein
LYQKVGSLVLQKKVQTAITSENYAEKTILLVAIKLFQKISYFLKAPVGCFLNYKTKKTK